MQFDLSADANLIIEQVRDFAKKEMAPLAAVAEHAECLASKGIEALGSYGLLAMRIPEAYGGSEMDAATCCRVLMEVAAVDASLAVVAALQNAWCVPLLCAAADDAQKDRWLGALAGGAWMACGGEVFAKEADPAGRWGGLLRAERVGEAWRLQGEARFVTLGKSASLLLLSAVDGEGKPQYFVLEGALRDRIEARVIEGKLGLRGTEVAHLLVPETMVPETSRLMGDLGSFDPWGSGRIAIAAVQVGVAQAALSQAIQYAQQRHQFGQAISGFQAIQWKLADMAMKSDAAQLLVDQAADAWQRSAWEEVSVLGRAARLFAGEAAVWIGQEAIQIHGGYGFIREFSVERYYRDAQTLRARWGGASAQQYALAETWWQDTPERS